MVLHHENRKFYNKISNAGQEMYPQCLLLHPITLARTSLYDDSAVNRYRISWKAFYVSSAFSELLLVVYLFISFWWTQLF